MNIIYIGNKLSWKGLTPTTIETLGPRLSSFVAVSSASSKRHYPARLWEMRPQYGEHEIVAHVEVSRLLSEHGLMGLIISFIYIFSPVILFLKANTPFQKAVMLFVFTIAIATSMHSAMRTFITPFFYGLGFAVFFPSKN